MKSSGLAPDTCSRVLTTSIGVVYPCDHAAESPPAAKNRQSSPPIETLASTGAGAAPRRVAHAQLAPLDVHRVEQREPVQVDWRAAVGADQVGPELHVRRRAAAVQLERVEAEVTQRLRVALVELTVADLAVRADAVVAVPAPRRSAAWRPRLASALRASRRAVCECPRLWSPAALRASLLAARLCSGHHRGACPSAPPSGRPGLSSSP